MKYICGKPGRKSISIHKRDHKVISRCVTREFDFVFKKGKGVYIQDVDDKKYLDFCSSVAVNNTGNANPEVAKAIKKQLKFGSHCGFSDFYAELPVKFAEKLLTHLPKYYNNVFYSNSGTESIEAMYKCARWHTNKKLVIAFDPCFHGRTMGSLSITKSLPIMKERFAPFLPVKYVPYPYVYRHKSEDETECSNDILNKVEKLFKKDKKNLAGIFIEPIMGEGGYVIPPKQFMKGLRKLCNKYNILLCADEIQAGCYRTGKFLSMDNFGITSDITALSKSIGGGIPMGVTISNRKVMNWIRSAHANTFGGNLIACAAGIANLDYMKKKKLGNNAIKIGKYMKKRLDELKDKYEIIGDTRGIGLMLAVEFVKNRKTKEFAVKERDAIRCKAIEKGLITLGAGKSSIRISPPLIINKSQAEKGIDILEDSIKDVIKR